MLKHGYQSAHDLQRHKVLTQSIYGIWQDTDKTIELKLSPLVGGAKIKIWTVNDLSVIRKISSFCGLDTNPKRARWQGFDLVTHLEKNAEDSFHNGIVNMPNNVRRNLADFTLVDDHLGYLTFFYQELTQNSYTRNESGVLVLQKKSNPLYQSTT